MQHSKIFWDGVNDYGYWDDWNIFNVKANWHHAWSEIRQSHKDIESGKKKAAWKKTTTAFGKHTFCQKTAKEDSSIKQ